MNDDPRIESRSGAQEIVRLRGEPPRVVRLSRKAVGVVGAGALLLVGGALIFAFGPPAETDEEELYNTEGIAMADGLASAPEDYSQVPQLGPPLPGDLGKPILDARNRDAVAALPPVGEHRAAGPAASPAEAARRQAGQERAAARSSRLFFGSGPRGASPEERAAKGTPAAPQPNASLARQSVRDRPDQPGTASRAPLEAAPSLRVLQAGSIIPAALITGIRSDLPGLVTAQVTQNVYDSLTGRILLIPQGSRLIGDYESGVGFGQRRVQLSWTRLILPDGRSIMLDRQPASDPSGYTGLEDDVDFHWGGLLKAALVSTLLSVGAASGASDESELAMALRYASEGGIDQAGEKVVSRELGVRPTLTIRPGYPLRVLVTSDLALPPEK